MKSAKTDGRRLSRLKHAGKELARALLQAASDGMLVLEGARRYPRVAAYEGAEGLRRIYAEREQWEAKKRLRDLKRRGLIEERRAAGRILIACTEKGENSLLRQAFKRAPTRPDGRAVLVIFDIPERQRSARAALRTLLRSCGCRRIQQSVWMTRRDIVEPLSKWVRRGRLETWVRAFVIEPLAL